jgi:type VI secretion system protein ImpF
MSRLDNEIRVTPSVIDRIIDYEPKDSKESPKSRSTSLMELKQAVRRDLEWLLNTRRVIRDIDERLEEVKKSVVYYGLPDITGVSMKNHNEQKRLTKAIETAIKYFEPRFIDLKVTLEPFANTDRQLLFRIEAQLDIEPTPEPIVFDTMLQLGSGEFGIKEV